MFKKNMDEVEKIEALLELDERIAYYARYAATFTLWQRYELAMERQFLGLEALDYWEEIYLSLEEDSRKMYLGSTGLWRTE